MGYEERALVLNRLAELRRLSFEQASALPEATSEDRVVADRKCVLSTFRQPLPADRVLVTVQIAIPMLAGLAGVHMEEGLVFSREQPVRDATPQELLESGG